MRLRRWWNEPFKKATHKADKKPKADPGRQADLQPFAIDPLRLLKQPATPTVLTQAFRWLGRAYGNRQVQRLLAKVRGTGWPLDAETRHRMESAFSEDFSEVRTHTGPDAEVAALELGAKAVTHGQDIYFGPNRYDPDSREGQRLLAHELAHTVQQKGGSAVAGKRRMDADPERAAEQAADSAAKGLPLEIILAASEVTPAMSPGPWGDDVRAARRITDISRRRAAMVVLARRALRGTAIRVHVAGNSSPTQVHPNDYRPAPVLNFDVNLNSKRSWPSTPGAPTRALSINEGYFFTRGSTAYAIIGPRALNPASPLFTRMRAEHELYHTRRHVRTTVSFVDRELETWTLDFRNYFHQLYRYRVQWGPLIDYYQRATSGARRRSLSRLVSYYNSPPVPAREADRVRAAFARWLRRRLRHSAHRSMQLIRDLESRLHLTGGP